MKNRILRNILLTVALLAFSPNAYADVNDFIITSFNAEYNLTNEDPQGRLIVKESITIEFSDNNHGIVRALPLKYKTNLKTQVLSVKKLSGEEWPFSTSEDNDNLIIKIGDPKSTVTGEQIFIINYQMDNVITFYGDHDELYWDINGDDWDQPFVDVGTSLSLPSGVKLKDSICYAGGYGEQINNCQISAVNDKVLASAVNLKPNQTLTTVLLFEKGFFKQPTWRDWLTEHIGILASSVLLPIVIGTLTYNRWKKFGRDPKGRGTIVPEFSPPKGLSPAEVGTVIDYDVGTRDISATIIDLAIRKYLKIIVEEKSKLFKKSKEYSFELLNPEYSALKPHEMTILEGIFAAPAKKNQIVKLSDLNEKFYKTTQSVQKSLAQNLTSGGYFSANPTKAGTGLWILAIILVFGAVALHNFMFFGLLISGLIVGVFAKLMRQRTQSGQHVKDQIEGLKLYLKVAEADRLKMLHSPDAPYTAKSSEPKHTIEVFEKLLPFAVVLGVEKEWAKQFEGIYSQPPEWYSGNWNTFNMGYFASNITDGVSAMGSTFSPPSSSGSSGGGGGGFSGGGGGGGGGGGW